MARLALLLAAAYTVCVDAAPARELRRKIQDERAVALDTNQPVTTSYSSRLVSSVQTASITVSPSVTGSVLTALPSAGNSNPLNTPSISAPTTSLAPVSTTLTPATTDAGSAAAANLFVPIATDAPPQQITTRNDHNATKDHITQDTPIETNKFYANFFLGSQSFGAWTQPYSLTWVKGNNNNWGIAVSHIDADRFAWDLSGRTPPEYFIGPIGLQPIVFSAAELDSSTTMNVDNATAFSANANLVKSGQELITLPLVQGMGFVTALYNQATPELTSGTFFSNFTYVGENDNGTYKWQIVLNDQTNWLLYVTPSGSEGVPPFNLKDSSTIVGPTGFVGSIQVAKNSANTTGEAIYDASAGTYATSATLGGSVDGNTGSYTLSWKKDGNTDQKLLMFTLPHHQESFDATTKSALTSLQLQTITKGMAKAVVADSITMIEDDLPTTIGFGPWVPNSSSSGGSGSENTNLNAGALQQINSAGALELAEDINAQTDLNSMYYSGKGLSKFATICYTLQEIAKNSELAAAGLVKLKDAFNVFVNNTQPNPLVYDSVWKGVVSSATYTDPNHDSGLDFGNTFYNDHHFHYGYFVHAASIIGYLDPTWLTQGTNKAWVNALIRDYANPSDQDPYFPISRSFDWFHGHSWAKGLFESGDGKDQESTSEDSMSLYAIKMWGKITGDSAMEARGNLQLAIQARSLRNYFLLESTNTVQPAKFIPNKVTGILFENKIDHTTYFGSEDSYIEGIHMIPIAPYSAYTRSRTFVQEEWDTYFSNGRADTTVATDKAWESLLYANLAIIDPTTSYSYFSDAGFDYTTMLDGGASKTWYLAYSAAMGSSGTLANGNNTKAEVEQVASVQPSAAASTTIEMGSESTPEATSIEEQAAAPTTEAEVAATPAAESPAAASTTTQEPAACTSPAATGQPEDETEPTDNGSEGVPSDYDSGDWSEECWDEGEEPEWDDETAQYPESDGENQDQEDWTWDTEDSTGDDANSG